MNSLWIFLFINAASAFQPANRAALKTAVDACLAETPDGSCPNFAASNDDTDNPYGLIGSWDTSQVTDMEAMFLQATAFKQPLTHWVTARVTNMERMFLGARAFNQPLTSFDTSQVTTMAGMFWGATAFNQPLTFDTSQVTNMERMFEGAIAFNHYKWGAELTCAELKAEYQSSSRDCGC
jgi:surface protein